VNEDKDNGIVKKNG